MFIFILKLLTVIEVDLRLTYSCQWFIYYLKKIASFAIWCNVLCKMIYSDNGFKKCECDSWDFVYLLIVLFICIHLEGTMSIIKHTCFHLMQINRIDRICNLFWTWCACTHETPHSILWKCMLYNLFIGILFSQLMSCVFLDNAFTQSSLTGLMSV